ncbi:MAG TPA: hypothetical protein VND45_16340 [Thermoanaerobaculia bacterium]|nr:hypothetical protein [Thermoanaerobaculia bacterium]
MTRHRYAFAFLAAVATALFLLPLLRGDVFTLRDHFDYFQPLRWFTATELQAGRMPLWNPYNASGEPWLANPQTGVFYPPAWLFVALPFPAAYMLFLLVHLVVLGGGAYLLFARDATEGTALFGAMALMFCGPVLSLLDVSTILATLAWIPLALWCAAEGAWKRGGVVLALGFLAGEPFFAAVASLLFVARAWGRNDGLKPVVRSAFIAIGVSAVQLFPFLEMLRGSDRAAGLDSELILLHSMSWTDWLRFVLPLHRETAQQFIPQLYTGVLVCALALLGIRKRTWPWLALFIACAIVSMGPALLTRMSLTLFRYPARLVPLAAFALVALAVAGWERVRPQRRWVDLVLIAIVVIDLVPRALPLLHAEPFRRDVVPYARAVGAASKFLRASSVEPAERTAWISGYLNLYDRRFDAFTAAPVASETYMRAIRALIEKPTRVELARKGIGWVIARNDLTPAFAPVARAGGVIVYRNRSTLPLAFLATRSPLTVRPARVDVDSSHVRVSVDAPKEGVVVVLQQRAPGWRVSVDGIEAPDFAVDTIFRGAQVTRGHHEVVWTYRPRSLFFGALVTFVTLLAMTFATFVKRAR